MKVKSEMAIRPIAQIMKANAKNRRSLLRLGDCGRRWRRLEVDFGFFFTLCSDSDGSGGGVVDSFVAGTAVTNRDRARRWRSQKRVMQVQL